MKQFELLTTRLADTAADSIMNHGAEEAALESHLQALTDRLRDIEAIGSAPRDIADSRLQMARTLVGLDRGTEAWPLARAALDQFLAMDDFELAADACDVCFSATSRSPSPPSARASGSRSPAPSTRSSASSF